MTDCNGMFDPSKVAVMGEKTLYSLPMTAKSENVCWRLVPGKNSMRHSLGSRSLAGIVSFVHTGRRPPGGYVPCNEFVSTHATKRRGLTTATEETEFIRTG